MVAMARSEISRFLLIVKNLVIFYICHRALKAQWQEFWITRSPIKKGNQRDWSVYHLQHFNRAQVTTLRSPCVKKLLSGCKHCICCRGFSWSLVDGWRIQNSFWPLAFKSLTKEQRFGSCLANATTKDANVGHVSSMLQMEWYYFTPPALKWNACFQIYIYIYIVFNLFFVCLCLMVVSCWAFLLLFLLGDFLFVLSCLLCSCSQFLLTRPLWRLEPH